MDNKKISNPDVNVVQKSANTVSCTEFTGLLQKMPNDSENELEYNDIYNIPKQGGLDRIKRNNN